MNYGDFEAHVRRSMNDDVTSHVDTNATWKNAEIVQWTNDAIADYSQHFPNEKADTISVVAGTSYYALPADIIQPPDAAIVKLTWQRQGYTRDHMAQSRLRPGATEDISLTGTGKGYQIFAGNVYLEDSPSARDANYDMDLWYFALHDLMPTTIDATLWASEFSLPAADLGVLFWFVTSLMMSKLESDDSFLRQYADREDLGIYRDDNPARKSAEWRMNKYDKDVALRLAKKKSPKLRRRTR